MDIKREITPFLLLIGAIIAFGLLSALGALYNLGKAIYESFQLKFWKGMWHFIKYWLRVAYQFWNVLKYYMLHTAIALDLIGNVAGGEIIEDCVTSEEETLYGRGDVTVSAATGELEVKGKLNKTGKWFTWLLSKLLGPKHSIQAYLSQLRKS